MPVISVVAVPCSLRYANKAAIVGICRHRWRARHPDSLDLRNLPLSKRGMTLNLKGPHGKEPASQLAKSADVRYKTPLDRAANCVAINEDIGRDAWTRAHAERVGNRPGERGINMSRISGHVERATA